MYTPRRSSHLSEPDPSSAIRVLIQPSQSAYFAGEPFSCTITFTNTRNASPMPAAAGGGRSVPLPASPGFPASTHAQHIAPFNPGHRRAVHSVSSAPLSRPPTSPGTPKTAYPSFPSFAVAQEGGEDDPNDEGRIKRRGLIGKGPAAVGASGRKKRQHPVRSLSVDISPQDLLRRLGEEPPGPAQINAVPSSPVVPSPLARDSNLPSSHPHARKTSVTVDVPSAHSAPSPLTPTTSSSSFQSSLSSITENNNTSSTVRRPSSLQAPHPGTRSKSLSSPPVTAFAASFPNHVRRPPSSELLLYGYAQLTGTFSLDPVSVSSSEELIKLRETLKRRGAIGGGSLDIGAGESQSHGKGGGGFWGFWGVGGASTKGGMTPVSPGESTSGGEEDDDALPTLETQPSMLAIDLELAPGESRTYSYTLGLPDNLAPTFRGRAFRFSYQLVVGACRAATPFGGGSADRRRSRVMRVPIRVYNYVAVGRIQRPYDLFWPIARRREKALEGKTEEVKEHKGIVQPARRPGTLESVQAYAKRLLAGEIELDAEEADHPAEVGGLSGCREAVEITTRNPKKNSYDVTMNGEKVAELTFVKSAYRLGETVLGVVELNEEQARSRVMKLSAFLEAHERLPWTGETVRRVHGEHHGSLVVDMQRVSFALDIPSDASPGFEICGGDGTTTGGLEWKLRLCLLVSVGTGSGDAKGKRRAIEVRGMVRDGSPGEWGRTWRAADHLVLMERVRVPEVPVRPAVPTTSRSRFGVLTALLNPFVGGAYHDADEEDWDGNDDEGWTEMGLETVECVVPVRVYPGNTAFRALEVVFEV